MNEIFKYWVEYDTLSGETARKILTEQHVKANIDSNLKPIVNYMESRMVFPFGPQESDSFKCKHFYVFFSLGIFTYSLNRLICCGFHFFLTIKK